ncbi:MULTISPECIES: YcjF family protein [Bacillaceae]|uniref:GTP-binding protein n=1 Tax=Alkalicoccobacillus plakortidis TaxID=444060 RepID=A0A9D5DPS3_9BACI|nr:MULTISPECIES: GTPase [Bacillaceae]KQL55578.1 GTP-binding protein [Alkalicoccobacillus plakortidis]RQW18677.1 GTP-binding protein [Bacillus sp. C1-1]
MASKFDAAFNQTFNEQMESINRSLEEDVLFALIGDINTGKSTTINALFGADVAPTSGLPGKTVEIKKYAYKEHIQFVDTPGLNDVVQTHSQETITFYKDADVVLFFLNAAGTVLSETEAKELEKLATINKDILIVLNKVDIADDVPSLLHYIQEKTSYRFKVIPLSSKTGFNLGELEDQIGDILQKKNKELQFAKALKDKSRIANKWINRSSLAAASAGAIPVPGSDIVPITAVQVGLMIKLAKLYEKTITKDRAKELIVTNLVSNIGRTAFRQLSKFVPGWGSAISAGVAGTLTWSLGKGIKKIYEQGLDLNVETLVHYTKKFKAERENAK